MPSNIISTAAAKMSRTTEYRYNVDGLLEELICHNGSQEQVTRWDYGVDVSTGSKVARADLVRSKVYPDGGDDRVAYSYNRLGNVIGFEDQNGTEHAYEYDALGRMVFDKVPHLGTGIDGTVKALGVTFTDRGETAAVTSYSNAAGTGAVNEVAFTYNGFSQVTAERQQVFGAHSSDESVGYEYADAAGSSNTARRTAVNYPTTRTLGYAYSGVLDDALSRVSNIADTAAGTVTLANYAWLGAGVPVVTAYPVPALEMSAITATGELLSDAGDPYASFDRFGRFQEVRWRQDSTEVERVQFGFDRTSNIRWRHNLMATSEGRYDEVYVYDGLYQLQALARGNLNQNRTAIGGSPAWQEAWKYDEVGNWLDYKTAVSKDSGSPLIRLNQARSYNAANELLFINDSNAMVAHDLVGNMLRAPVATAWDDETPLIAQTYAWDAWNRLTEARSGLGATLRLGQYQYDGLNRRIFKHEEIDEVFKDRHLYYNDQWQVLEQQTDTEGTIDRQFVWGIKGLDDLILRQLISEVPLSHYSINDGKNVTAVANDSGTIVERYAYHGFGFSEVLDASFSSIPGNVSTIEWETRFCGYNWDAASQLYLVRYRCYHPMLGRWLNTDPIGEKEGCNLYAYCVNYAISASDHEGLAAAVNPPRLEAHHWFPKSRKLQPKMKKLCPKLDIDRFTTAYFGPNAGTEHWWITHPYDYNKRVNDLADHAVDCCDFLMGVFLLIVDVHSLLRGHGPGEQVDVLDEIRNSLNPLRFFPEMAPYSELRRANWQAQNLGFVADAPSDTRTEFITLILQECGGESKRMVQVPYPYPDARVGYLPRESSIPCPQDIYQEPYQAIRSTGVQIPANAGINTSAGSGRGISTSPSRPVEPMPVRVFD